MEKVISSFVLEKVKSHSLSKNNPIIVSYTNDTAIPESRNLSLLLPVKVCEEFVTKVFARVIEPDLLIDRIDLFNIRRLKLEGNIKVLYDSLWRL